MAERRIYGFVTLNRVGKSDTARKAALAAYAAREGLAFTPVEGRYSKKKKWRERAELVKLIDSLRPGDTVIVPEVTALGTDAADRISCVAAIIGKRADLHLADSGLALDAAALGKEGSSLFTLLYLLASALATPAEKERKGSGRGPGRPKKKRRGRPPKRKHGRPPKRKVGRPKKKGKPGRKPARKKRVSALQDRFNKEILTIRKYLVNRFSVRTIAEMLEMPYQPLRALIKKHPTLKELVKKGR